QGALPELSPRFRQRLAHRHRRHRRSLPPHRGRPLRRHRSPLGTRRRRSDPQATSTPQQRRLPELLDVAPGPRTTTRPRIPLPRRRPTQGSMTSLQRSHTRIDLHRRRTVIVRATEAGEVLETVQIAGDVERLASVMARAGQCPEVVLEATYGWYWAVDALQAGGANVHLAQPLGVKAFEYRRVKNDLLTELPGPDSRVGVRLPIGIATFPAHDQRRGRVAGVVRVGGAAGRVARGDWRSV